MTSIVLLMVSLVLNAVLIGTLLRTDRTWSGLRQPPSLHGTSDQNVGDTSTVASPRREAGTFSSKEGSLGFHWSQLETSDWFTYRDGLLQIGCPASTVRDILKPLVTRHYTALCQERLRPFVDEFWDRFRPPMELARAQMNAELESIEREEKDVMDRLFGSLPANDPAAPSPNARQKRQLDFLSEDLQSAVLERLAAHRRRLRKTADAKFPTAQDQSQAYLDLQDQFEAELAEILSPAQMDELMLRRSPLARFREIEGHDLNEAELWEVIRRAKSMASPEDARDAEYVSPKQVQEAMEAVLGPERTATVQRAEQPEFQQLLKVTRRLELPQEQAVEVWKAQEALVGSVQKLIQDSSLSDAERRARVQQLRESLGKQVEGMLGGARARETWEHALQPFLDQKSAIPDFDPVSALESP